MNEEELQKLLATANKILLQGDKDKAISLYEDIINKDPNNAEAHMKLADLYSAKGMNDRASHELLLLGNAYYESRLFRNALKYFQRLLEIEPGHIDARIKAAEIYVNEEMEREAKFEYLAIAEHYLSANDLTKAEEFAKKAIEHKSIEAHYIMGLVYFKRGMFSEAMISLETLTKIKVNHVGALLHLGYCYTNKGKYSEASTAFTKALKVEPENIDALKGLADAYAKKGSITDASGFYTKAMDSMIKAKEYENAVKFGLEFVKDLPVNPEGYLKLAQVFECQSSSKDAIKYYKMAGDNYVKQKIEAKAKECFDKISFLGQSVTAGSQSTVENKPAADKPETVSNPDEDLIERNVPSSHSKPKVIDTLKKSFMSNIPDELSKVPPPKQVVMPKPGIASGSEVSAVSEADTQLTQVKSDVDALFKQAEKHMKDCYYEKAIEIYRVILKKELRNTLVRQKLHQAYLLLAQQEEETGSKTISALPKKDGSKEKKSRISYL